MSGVIPDDAPVLFYDAECAVCARSVRTILKLEGSRGGSRGGSLGGSPRVRFAARRGVIGDALHAERPELEDVDSLVWRDADGTVRVRSGAMIAIARYLGGVWGVMGCVAACVPRAIRDGTYRAFAKRRHWFAFGGEACLVPPEEAAGRFLDRGCGGGTLR